MLMYSKFIPDFDFIRKNVSYILLYNENKSGVIQKSDGLTQNYDYLTSLPNTETRLFDIASLESYLFNKAHTYTKELFETKFVAVKEKEENL